MVPFLIVFQKPEGIFPWYLLWESGRAPGSKSHSIVRVPDDRVPQECLTLSLVPMETPAIHQLQFRFLYPGTASPGGFWWQISSQVSLDLLCSSISLSNPGDSGLPCVLHRLTDPRRVADFYLLLELQAPYMWNQAPEVLLLSFNNWVNENKV